MACRIRQVLDAAFIGGDSITSIVLRIIAIITMTIDHAGMLFFDNNPLMRAIGRTAFPLFALMFCEGLIYTKNPKKRTVKLLLLAVITEPIYDMLIFGTPICWGNQNILFVFALISASCLILDNTHHWYEHILIIMLTSLMANFLNLDYSLTGAVAIFLCYYIVKNKYRFKRYKIVLFVPWIFLALSYIPFLTSLEDAIVDLGYLLPLIFIYLYNGKKGECNKKLYTLMYLYYPLHLAVMLIIKLLMTSTG